MTREEAINKWIIPAIRNTWNHKKCEEILIALEQEPCIQEKQANADKIDVNLVKFDTPYADTISRQSAIDAMREETCMSCWDAKDILKHLPHASTEKIGRWINDSCSICNYGVQPWNNTPYCPNCRAKMEEAEE